MVNSCNFLRHQPHDLESLRSVGAQLSKPYQRHSTASLPRRAVQGLACPQSWQDISRHVRSLRSKGILGPGNKKSIVTRGDTQPYDALHQHSPPFSCLSFTLRHCPVSYYEGYITASPGKLQLAHVTKQRSVGSKSPAPRQQNNGVVSEAFGLSLVQVREREVHASRPKINCPCHHIKNQFLTSVNAFTAPSHLKVAVAAMTSKQYLFGWEKTACLYTSLSKTSCQTSCRVYAHYKPGLSAHL